MYVGVVIFLFTNVPFICKNSNFSLFFLGANVRVVLQTRKQRHSNASAVAKLSSGKLEAVSEYKELPPICLGFNLVV